MIILFVIVYIEESIEYEIKILIYTIMRLWKIKIRNFEITEN